jgi:hypothetical protein
VLDRAIFYILLIVKIIASIKQKTNSVNYVYCCLLIVMLPCSSVGYCSVFFKEFAASVLYSKGSGNDPANKKIAITQNVR